MVMTKQAVILAGGKGTRLGRITQNIPKPLVKIGDKAIVEHQLALLKTYGIEEVILTVGHLKESLQEVLGDGRRYGVNITYFLEKEPLGTAGAFPLLSDVLQEDFFVLYGDVMTDADLAKIDAYHRKHQALATLVVHPNDHPYDSDLIECDNSGVITAFHNVPHDPDRYYKNLVNAGLYVFRKEIIRYIEQGKGSDFGRDVLPALTATRRLAAYNTSEYLKDMGTPSRLEKVTKDYLSGKVARRNLKNKQKAIFLDRDGVINEDRHLIARPEDLVLYDFVPDALLKVNDSDYLSIVVTNQSVVARNLCTIDELETIHRKLDTQLGVQGAKTDALYYCPYHPDKGYPEENPDYKKEHPWRKPRPGMLLHAAERFNIDLAGSYMIGDRESDILAGKGAGVTTVGVRTGNGLKGCTVDPDYFFDDMREAVGFIVDEPLKKIADALRRSVGEAAPFIICIGGNAGSGKTTLATYLHRYFTAAGLSATVLSLDHWLLPAAQRADAESVLERFPVKRIDRDLRDFLNGKAAEPGGYSKDPARRVEKVRYVYGRERVVIVEGVVSLELPFATEKAHERIFMRLGAEQYRQRFKKRYRRKGFEEAKITALLAQRLGEEFELIDKNHQKATLTVDSL